MKKVGTFVCFFCLFQLFIIIITNSVHPSNGNNNKESACSAVVNLQERTAAFLFPGVRGTNWTWYRETTHDDILEYAWTISLGNGDPPASSFGAYLWKFSWSKQQIGTLEALLRKCQHSVFDNSGRLKGDLNAVIKAENGVVTIFVDDIRTFGDLFQERPRYAYFKIRLPDSGPSSCEAEINYQGLDDSSPSAEPPEEVRVRSTGHKITISPLNNPGNLTSACNEIRKSADEGDAENQMTLGVMYEKGLGIRQDEIEAARWYRKAAEQGHTSAQTILGSIYRSGRGVPQDYSEALKWYLKAANKGAAVAQFETAMMYNRGLGVQQDYAEAAKWYRKVAETGFAPAQYYLASLYEDGAGVPKDYGEALKWYRKAADQGFPEAQTNLGAMYADGLGVPQDFAEAVKWYLKAAAHDYPIAQSNLGIAYHTGKGAAQDHAEAVKWFTKAAEQGDPTGQFWLGVAYAKGEGVARNPVQACMWLILANEQGFEQAAEIENSLVATMTETQIDEAQRLAREWKAK